MKSLQQKKLILISASILILPGCGTNHSNQSLNAPFPSNDFNSVLPGYTLQDNYYNNYFKEKREQEEFQALQEQRLKNFPLLEFDKIYLETQIDFAKDLKEMELEILNKKTPLEEITDQKNKIYFDNFNESAITKLPDYYVPPLDTNNTIKPILPIKHSPKFDNPLSTHNFGENEFELNYPPVNFPSFDSPNTLSNGIPVQPIIFP